MLTINKTYNISANDDRSATAIRLNDVLAGELFTALKELGNFMTIEKTEY